MFEHKVAVNSKVETCVNGRGIAMHQAAIIQTSLSLPLLYSLTLQDINVLLGGLLCYYQAGQSPAARQRDCLSSLFEFPQGPEAAGPTG